MIKRFERRIQAVISLNAVHCQVSDVTAGDRFGQVVVLKFDEEHFFNRRAESSPHVRAAIRSRGRLKGGCLSRAARFIDHLLVPLRLISPIDSSLRHYWSGPGSY